MRTAAVGVHYAPRSRLGIDFKAVAIVDYIYPRRTWIISADWPHFFILNDCIKFQLTWREMVEVKEPIRARAKADALEEPYSDEIAV